MDNLSGIYALVSPSGKAYIGSSKNLKQREYEHLYLLKRNKHHCTYLQNAWNKYNGFFSFRVIELCELKILLEREQYWIDNHLDLFSGMYNIGLKVGRVDFTAEVRAKMSQAAKKRIYSLERRKAISERQKGKVRSKETVEKIAKANRGQKRSLETRLKMQQAALNRKRK